MISKIIVSAVVAAVALPVCAAPEVVTPAKQEVRVKEATPKNTIYVNAMEAMQTSKKGSQKLTSIEKKRKELGDTIEKKEQQLKQRVTEYKSKESTLSSAAREKEESTLVKMRREFESLVQTSEDDLKLAMQRATEELSQEIEKAAPQLAIAYEKEKGKPVDAIIDLYTGRTIWASTEVVKTADLVKVMDQQFALASAKPEAAAKTTA